MIVSPEAPIFLAIAGIHDNWNRGGRHGGQFMQRCLYGIFSVVMALCGVLLVAVPRFYLLPPVPVGMVAQNIHRLPPNQVSEAKADTGKRYHHEEFFASWEQGIRFVSFTCINDPQESNEESQCSRPMMFNDNK